MPAFGRDEMLDREQVRNVAAYVYSLTQSRLLDAGERRPDRGRAGGVPDDLRGRAMARTPRATAMSALRTSPTAIWVYGGELDTIIASVHGGRQGHMPTWDERLTTAEIRTLALYVHDLGTQQP